MAREIHKLTTLDVRNETRPGKHADGGGLYLQVGPTGSKSWAFRFMLDGKARQMGLGPVHTVSLKDARMKAQEARAALLEGIDPLTRKQQQRAARKAEAVKVRDFEDCAKSYIRAHRAGWRNPKHAAQWDSTLSTYVFPVFGSVGVADVDTGLVLKAIEPIWTEKPETAGRVRGRIEAILDWAAARGLRGSENPARWKGHLDKILPARSKVRKVKHHPALPYAQAPAFLQTLKAQQGVGARALEFTIYTAARSGETLGADWSEIDLEARLWTIPGERMKGGREHRVPLSDAAVTLLEAIKADHGGEGYVFPGARKGRPLSNMSMTATLRRMGRDDVTAHGFRSTFRDWAAERTSYPGEVAEMALAHAVGDRVEAAYRRGDLFDKRRRLMADWAAFLERPADASGKVIALA